MKIVFWIVNMDKWYYIEIISKMSNKYGDKLLEMMDYYNKDSLLEIDYEEVKEFYEKLNNK